MPANAKQEPSDSPRPRPRPLVLIVGPTGVGKTALSLRLAERFGGEVVSADSRLFYRGVDVGTAKPSAEERALVRHHLIDVCWPDQTLTLGEYQRLAFEAINDIHRRGNLPLLVGGTGQYVRAVVEGWRIPKVPPQQRLRQHLASLGGAELARWLRTLDPKASRRIEPSNVRRVVRALEVTLVTGRPISDLQRRQRPPYVVKALGLSRERAALYRKLDQRVEAMMAAGLLDEVRALRDAGYGRQLASLSGLGYRQLMAYLSGELALEEAVERIKFETHRYVRQQHNWFRLDDPAISWFDVDEVNWQADVERTLGDWLARLAPSDG